MATCYRHSSRETGVSCANCGRPICPDCMTTTPVGMRCPECSRAKTRVHRLASTSDRPVVTNGDWWRLITAGFLHGVLLHIGFNMYILWFLGNLLEPSIGPVRFLAL